MEKRMQQPMVTVILAAMACFLWGSAFPAVKTGYEWFQIEDTGSQLVFAGCRFSLAGIVTWLTGCVMDKRWIGVRRKNWGRIGLLGLVQTGLQYFFFYIGLAHTTGVKGSVLNAVNVFAVIILAHFFTKTDRITRNKALGCAIGFVGIILVNYSGDGFAGGVSWNGEGFLICAALCYGAASLLTKRLVREEAVMAVTGIQLFIGGVLLLLAGWGAGGHIENFTLRNTTLLLYMVFISAAAFSIWTLLLKYNEAGKISVYTFLTPVFGAVLSALVLGEQILEIKNLIALLCVSAGIFIVNKPDKKGSCYNK